jgi:hypothetical protein
MEVRDVVIENESLPDFMKMPQLSLHAPVAVAENSPPRG